ncbi:MAG TPA: hypothetical protein VK753_09180 [Xanthomonadaceae bacterium]|jgi:hypothetical protein|nr:hypothetical protein [Xanthomonadaceae bacterium]
MRASETELKFLYAFSLPPLLILFSIIGFDEWDGYKWFATALVFAGGICAARAARARSNKLLTGIIYTVVVELVMICLP